MDYSPRFAPTMDWGDIARTVAAAAGRRLREVRSIAGGDVAVAAKVSTDGAPIFVKSRAGASGRDFEVEAAGLRWLAEPGVLRIPEVVAVGDDAQPFLALEWIERGAAAPDHDERLGRGLAALHRFGAPRFGLDHDNLIGPLPQQNDPGDDWPTFYGQRRLLALGQRAHRAGSLDASGLRQLEALARVLPARCGPAEPPARLHGDLWGGNAMVDDAGAPVLIDPAVYGGHREVDLAMMRLFGGFGHRVFAAYDEAYPLAPGAEDRVGLYQVYPLLVHVALFGGGYVGQLRSTVARYL